MSIEQLRERMPALRQREQALRAELQAIADQANDRAAFLRLAETLTAFLARLHGAADTLSILDRQRIVRLVVKDVLIGDDIITIRHSIPVQQGSPQGGCPPPSQTAGTNYLLCKGSGCRALRRARLAFRDDPFFEYSRLKPFADQAEYALVSDPVLQETDKPVMTYRVEKASVIGIEYPVHFPTLDTYHQRV